MVIVLSFIQLREKSHVENQGIIDPNSYIGLKSMNHEEENEPKEY